MASSRNKQANELNGGNGDGIDRTGAHSIWAYKLQASYSRIIRELYGDCHVIDGKLLRTPQFRINHQRWGEWDPSTRTISLCEDLFLRFEWGAVEHVLKHEIAHQIVSEIWDFDYRGHSHGEAFKRACKLLGISSERCTSESMLVGFRGDNELPVVDKVRKLLVKGNDLAVTEAESEIFLRKAHEMMARHSIDVRTVCGEDRLFISRPVGPLRKQWPSWENSLSALVAKYYGVKRLIMRSWDKELGYVQYMSLFGEPSSLDIAEYVYCAILNIGEQLYSQYLKERKAQHRVVIKKWENDVAYINAMVKRDPTVKRYFPPKPRVSRKASKVAFMSGLLFGYEKVLESQHTDVLKRIEAEQGESKSLLLLNDPMLEEAYHKAYPHICTHKSNYSFGAGRSEGYKAGQNMRIRTGVASGSIGERKQLT